MPLLLWLSWAEAADASALIHQIPPSYPTSPGLEVSGEVHCTVTLVVDAGGLPSDVQVSTCPPAFALSVRAAIGAWRWAERPGAEPQQIELALVFPELPPDPPAYRDLIVGLGPVLSPGHAAGGLRARMVAAARDGRISPILSLDAGLQLLRPPVGRWSVSGGASLGGEQARSALTVGVGQLEPEDGLSRGLWVPVEAATQLELGPIRAHLRGRLAWSLADPGPGWGPDPGGGALGIGLAWKAWAAFEPVPGPRLDLELGQREGGVVSTIVLGLGL